MASRTDGKKQIDCNRMEIECNRRKTIFARIIETRPARERFPPLQFQYSCIEIVEAVHECKVFFDAYD